MTVKNIDWLDIPDGFEFGIVETDEELDELVEFNTQIHGADDAVPLRRLIERQPSFGREMNYYIRESKSGKIVSSLNAIPSVWSYEGVPINNLELGYVGTLDGYRRRGLFRLLYTYFERVLIEGRYDISTIMGIPFFYRQFGYDFVIPLGRGVYLRAGQLPDADTTAPRDFMSIEIRQATSKDIDDLMVLYDHLCNRHLISSVRSKTLWKRQEEARKEYSQPFTTYILEDGGQIVGYFRVALRRDKDSDSIRLVDVLESSIVTFPGVRRALVHLRKLADAHGVCSVALPGTPLCNLSRIGLDMAGQMSRGWRFQVRIPDLVQFLSKVRPVLEQRLRNTMYASITRDLPVNTYRSCYMMSFVDGQIESIEDMGPQGHDKHTEFRTPRRDFVRLLLGQNRVTELAEINSDFIVSGEVRSLVNTLFPKRESYVAFYHC